MNIKCHSYFDYIETEKVVVERAAPMRIHLSHLPLVHFENGMNVREEDQLEQLGLY